MIGLDPTLVDFSAPEFAAFRGLDAAKVSAAVKADLGRLKSLGYGAELCFIDFGDGMHGGPTLRIASDVGIWDLGLGV